MAGGGESYFSAFALHFKATATDVGILATLPPLIGSFFQLLSVALSRVTRNRRNIILLGALLQVLSWLPLTLLPPLYPRYSLVIILGSLILFYGAGNLVTPQWTSLMGDLVPERKRGRYFSYRSRLSSITGLMALVGAGLVLQHFSESTAVMFGFVIIFAVSAVARMISAYHMWRMYEPPQGDVRIPSLGEWWARWRGTAPLRFSAYFSAMQFSVAIAGPFFTVYMLRDLGFSYLELMTNTAVSVLVQFLTLRTWGRIGDAFGHRLTLMVTGFCMPAVPALWLLSENFWYLLGAQAVSGLVWGGFTLSANNILFDLVPREDRVQYLASHNVMAGVSTFAGSLVGGLLATTLPAHWGLFRPASILCWLFLISAVLRLVSSATFLPRLHETRAVRPFSWHGLMYFLTGRRWRHAPRRRPALQPHPPAHTTIAPAK
jgi:MFS family permease